MYITFAVHLCANKWQMCTCMYYFCAAIIVGSYVSNRSPQAPNPGWVPGSLPGPGPHQSTVALQLALTHLAPGGTSADRAPPTAELEPP